MKNINEFDFWVPLSLSKAVDPASGKQEMFLEGIASTKDKDADGEYLDPEGFDLDYFMKAGIVNWHHQAAKNPGAIIGEPVEATITEKGLHVKVRLYDEDPLAKSVFEKAAQMERQSKTRRMGFSIEGQATERDPSNEAIVTKAMITGLAVTHMPKNSNTFATVCKALATGNGDALVKEDLDDKLTDQAGEDPKLKKGEEKTEEEKQAKWERRYANMRERKGLTKGQGTTCPHCDHDQVVAGKCLECGKLEKSVQDNKLTKSLAYEFIFSEVGDISVSSAENIYRLAQQIASNEMAKAISNPLLDGEVTEQDINKAVEALQLVKGKEADVADEDEEEENQELTKAVGTSASGLNSGKAFGAIMKGLSTVKAEQRERDRNMGVLLKGLFESNMKLSARNEELEASVALIQKGLEDLDEKLDQPVERRAVVTKAREPEFNKGLEDNDLTKGQGADDKTQKVNIRTGQGKQLVKGWLMDKALNKGILDQDMANAALSFDASGILSSDVVKAIETEKKIKLIAE